MKVWIEHDYSSQVVVVWEKENPYSIEADVPEALIKKLEHAQELYREAQMAILECIE